MNACHHIGHNFNIQNIANEEEEVLVAKHLVMKFNVCDHIGCNFELCLDSFLTENYHQKCLARCKSVNRSLLLEIVGSQTKNSRGLQM